MAKPPPNRLNKLFVPDPNHHFFAAARQNPFHHDAEGYDPVNAWWLAEACFLAYAGEADTRLALDRAGLKAAGFDVNFFAREGTHCFVLHDNKVVLVVFRGTQIDSFWPSVVDLATDARFIPVDDGAGGRVHGGFLQGLDRVWKGLSGHLRQLLAGEGARRTLWFAGHSLGGALALLAAERAARAVKLEVRGVYLFGVPRVGDAAFKQRLAALGLAERTYRVVNDSDAIAKIPPDVTYEHVGQLKLIDERGRLSHLDAAAALAHESRPGENTLGIIFGGVFFATALFASPLRRLPIPVPKPLADHAPIYYSVHLWNSFHPEE